MSTGKRVLIIDDDPSMLGLVSHVLGGEGFEAEVAADGYAGLRSIRQAPPDLVVCDIQMPGLDGFQVLDRVRGDAATAALPFVLLTAFNDRDSVRRGMRLGADDFLSKPVQPGELIEAVNVALDKRRRLSALVSGRALPVQQELREHYESKFERGETTPALGETDLAGMTGRRVTQTVLFTDIRGFTTMSERLPVTDIAELLTRYMREACKPILEQRGRIMKIMGDGLMALFGHESPDDICQHAAAGLRAGLQIVQVAQQFRHWVAARFDATILPPFDVGVGIHTGEVMLFQLSVGGSGDLTAVGDSVNVAARLEAKSKELGWPIVASQATIQYAGPGFNVAESREIELAGRDARITVGRLIPSASPPSIAPQAPLGFGIEALLQESARSTAEAAKQALDSTLHAIGTQVRATEGTGDSEPAVRGYRVLAKIGQGGMSSVFLAEEQNGERKVVLKVLKGRRTDDDGLWKRFFQECAILSSIQHEHVVRIYDQGFGDELAYIAMEHLSGGSLRELIDRGLTPRQALSLLSQAASGLGEIHGRGIVHRDIKPANLMLRDAGVLVLTDFGVAKRLDQSASQTVQGEILGTPYYISPEQADGGDITPASDFYSLGIIFYEMLTGRRPYAGATILEILAQHVAAPVPNLPAELAEYQALIDGMLAKRPQARFQSAEALLAAIDEVWTHIALKKDACTT